MSIQLHNKQPSEEDLYVHRQNELQDIFGPPPGWILHSGISVVVIVLALGLCLSWFIRFPDKLEATVILTSKIPSAEVIAPVGAYVDLLFVEEEEQVAAGQLLAVLENSANWEDVQELDRFLKTIEKDAWDDHSDLIPPLQLQLGELQLPYATFLQAFSEWRFYGTRTTTREQIRAIDQEVVHTKRLFHALREQMDLMQRELDLLEQDYRRDVQLRSDGVISDLDLETKERTVRQVQRQRKQIQTSLIQNEIRIEQLRSQQQDLRHERSEGLSIRRLTLLQTLELLQGALDQWKKNYQLRAPITGKSVLRPELAAKSYVPAGEIVLSILPSTEAGIIAQCRLSMQGVGKIGIGSPVQILLDAYPYKEFGVLSTEVSRLSLVPLDRANGESYYLAEVPLTLPLTTTYDKQLPFQPEMTGRAYLISEDHRLLERFFDRVIHLVKNQ